MMNNIESCENQVEENTAALREASEDMRSQQKQLEYLQKTIEYLENDLQVARSLEKNLAEHQENKAEIQKKMDRAIQAAQSVYFELEQMNSELNAETDIIDQLDESGEDVSEAKGILKERKTQIQNLLKQIRSALLDTGAEDAGEIQDNPGEGRLFSGKELMERFGTEKLQNGSGYFVKGDHFDRFVQDYYSSDRSKYTAYETVVELDISPSLIEGICLGNQECEEPSLFWSQHEKEGTAQSFQEIASHIPEVRTRLKNGESLDDLAGEARLAACANLYFRNKLQVTERNGYFEFDSNGRHRILAARALEIDIPVVVTGKRESIE